MATYVPPKKNTAFILYTALVSQADTKLFQANPTLAAGDVKVEIDGVANGNITTLPSAVPASGTSVKIQLTSDEMNGDNITVRFSDAAGAEWCDQTIVIQTCARQVDDLAYPTTSGRSLDVTATGEAGIDWSNIGAPTTTVNLSGTSTKAVEPTVASRTLDVSAGGEAGIDWANIGSPTTAVNLSGTSTKAVEPTVAGRTLDVSAGGEAGVDFANIGSPTTVVNLSGTTIKTATDIATAITALNNLSSAQVAALLTATIADSVPADGTRPSIASGVLMLVRFLFERSVVGTTMTVTKEDGVTSSMTFTLNDSTNPTAITRAT